MEQKQPSDTENPENYMRVGFVGLGRMGANMARRLSECGYSIAGVYDVQESVAAQLAGELDCVHANRLSTLTNTCDVIFTVVSDDSAQLSIYNDPADNLLQDEAKDTLFVNCATVSPHVHQTIEKHVLEHDAEVIEACMASSIPQARDGTLFLMIGGAPQTYERAKPILQHLGQETHYIGESGEAAKVKALVNLVMNMNTAALAEGLGIGQAHGIDLTVLKKIFSKTGAASRVLETDGDDMIQRDHECFFSAEHAAKDTGIALSMANQAALALPLAQATQQQYHRLILSGLGHLDKSGVAELTFPERYPKNNNQSQ